MILASHPTGNANVRHAVDAFREGGCLSAYHTTIAAAGGNFFARMASWPGLGEIRRRSYRAELRPFLHLSPGREIGRLLSLRLGLRSLIQHETGPFCVDAVYRDLDHRVARCLRRDPGRCQVVYAYEDGARETFRVARELGLRTVYDLPIGYWREARRIQQEEAERQPAWQSTMPALRDSPAKCARKDDELALADEVVVASQFTASTLKAAPAAPTRVTVIPYGCPPVTLEPLQTSPAGSPLRVLYVGGLSQRKGLSYLLAAVDKIAPAAQLTLIGRPAGSCQPLQQALQKHRWIESLPHEQVLAEMRQHDVLVFPSLFEGFGLVVTEALSQGTPVVTTAHTCGPDLLTEGRDGFLVPIRDAEAIADRLLRLHDDRERLAEMKEFARGKASEITWDRYHAILLAHMHSILGQSREVVS